MGGRRFRLKSCVPLASAPAVSVASAVTSARLTWGTPSVDAGPTNDDGNSVNGYRITVNGAVVRNLPASTHTTTLTGLRANTNATVGVAAITRDGAGAVRSVPIYATTARVTSVAKAKENKYFTVTGTVSRRGTTARVRGVRLPLQRHLATQRVWHTVSTAPTNARGVKAWKVKQTPATYYRVVATAPELARHRPRRREASAPVADPVGDASRCLGASRAWTRSPHPRLRSTSRT